MTNDCSYPKMKIAILSIGDGDYNLSGKDFTDFAEKLLPVLKKQFPDIEFMLMSQELPLVTTGLHELEHMLFSINHAIEELKQRYDSSPTTKTEIE